MIRLPLPALPAAQPGCSDVMPGVALAVLDARLDLLGGEDVTRVATAADRPARAPDELAVYTDLAKLKPEIALYVGGMGHKDKNFHRDMM